MNSKTIKVLSYVAITIAPIVLTYFLKKRYRKLLSACKPVDESNYSFIFITSKNLQCKQHIYKRTACSETCSYNYLVTLVKFMESAKESISLCMCIATSCEIQDALVRALNRGVRVRFIADKEMLGNTATRVKFLKEAGIPIKTQLQMQRGILHHKFCLVDENNPNQAKLFSGSLNLTLQGLVSNWDYTVFTNDHKVIKRYQEEFEYLWESFPYLI